MKQNKLKKIIKNIISEQLSGPLATDVKPVVSDPVGPPTPISLGDPLGLYVCHTPDAFPDNLSTGLNTTFCINGEGECDWIPDNILIEGGISDAWCTGPCSGEYNYTPTFPQSEWGFDVDGNEIDDNSCYNVAQGGLVNTTLYELPAYDALGGTCSETPTIEEYLDWLDKLTGVNFCFAPFDWSLMDVGQNPFYGVQPEEQIGGICLGFHPYRFQSSMENIPPIQNWLTADTIVGAEGGIFTTQADVEYNCCPEPPCYNHGCPWLDPTDIVDGTFTDSDGIVYYEGIGDTTDPTITDAPLYSVWPPVTSESELIISGICPEVKGETIFGCMNSDADNFDGEATVDDGSCTFTNLELIGDLLSSIPACSDTNSTTFYCDDPELYISQALELEQFPLYDFLDGLGLQPIIQFYDENGLLLDDWLCGVDDTIPANMDLHFKHCVFKACLDIDAVTYTWIEYNGSLTSWETLPTLLDVPDLPDVIDPTGDIGVQTFMWMDEQNMIIESSMP